MLEYNLFVIKNNYFEYLEKKKVEYTENLTLKEDEKVRSNFD